MLVKVMVDNNETKFLIKIEKKCDTVIFYRQIKKGFQMFLRRFDLIVGSSFHPGK